MDSKAIIESIFGSLEDYDETADRISFLIYGFQAQTLWELSDKFGVNIIHCYGESDHGGCDTCGYGAYDGVRIDFNKADAKVFQEPA